MWISSCQRVSLIVFEAGTYVGAIKLQYKDFADLVRPKVTAFHYESQRSTASSDYS
jgi:prolyl-tRNA editing enzyme YbaK/EbsC (Cys-tRNA(Pro) deacylase)